MEEENRIVPWRFHVPVPLYGTSSHSTCGTPPDAAMLFSFLSVVEKNAMVRLSGDQKGARALVDVSVRNSPDSRDRIARPD